MKPIRNAPFPLSAMLPLAALLLLAGAATAPQASAQPSDVRSPKQLNDPLPPGAMAPGKRPPGAVPTPRGEPEGMGNEKDFSKTPGDDDPSDGINEPGRNPVPGLPRPDPGVNTRPPAAPR